MKKNFKNKLRKNANNDLSIRNNNKALDKFFRKDKQSTFFSSADYWLGYWTAINNYVLKSKVRYQIIADNITNLVVYDKQLNVTLMKEPYSIFLKGEYEEFSKNDIIKIGFICGQVSQKIRMNFSG